MTLSVCKLFLRRILFTYFLVFFFGTPYLLALECNKKTDSVGLLEVSQMFDDGKCIIIIARNDPRLLAKNNANTFKTTRDFGKRRYTFTSDGFVELYDDSTAQEIQLNQIKNPLSYSIINNEISVRLPSGQKINFVANPDGKKGSIKSFTGFSAASETSDGLNLTPAGYDTLMTSDVVAEGFPHEKKNAKFKLINSEGLVASFQSSEIFEKSLPSSYPQLRPDFLNKIQNVKLTSKVSTEVTKFTSPPVGSGEKEEPIKSPNRLVHASECSNSQSILEKLDADYLKIQGELTLSKLAYYYLKDSADSTETLEQKIKTLLVQKDVLKSQKIIDKKIKLNESLTTLKDHFLEQQKKWKSKDNENFLLSGTDFKFISLVNEVEKKASSKNQIINFISMIDSSYRLSANSKEDKLVGLEKRFLVLNQKLETNLKKINSIKTLCHLEAQSTCVNCFLSAKEDNLSALKKLSEHQPLEDQIQWGSFWLHTGKKTKSPAPKN